MGEPVGERGERPGKNFLSPDVQRKILHLSRFLTGRSRLPLRWCVDFIRVNLIISLFTKQNRIRRSSSNKIFTDDPVSRRTGSDDHTQTGYLQIVMFQPEHDHEVQIKPNIYRRSSFYKSRIRRSHSNRIFTGDKVSTKTGPDDRIQTDTLHVVMFQPLKFQMIF